MHNGRVRPVSVPEPDAFPSKMAQLMGRRARRLGIGRDQASPR